MPKIKPLSLIPVRRSAGASAAGVLLLPPLPVLAPRWFRVPRPSHARCLLLLLPPSPCCRQVILAKIFKKEGVRPQFTFKEDQVCC